MRKLGSRNSATGLLVAGLGAAVMLSASVEASAQSGDNAGGYIVYPEVRTRPADPLTGAPAIDTLIQLTNTGDKPTWVQCYYINANGRCGDPKGDPCWTSDDCVIQLECDPTTLTCGGVLGGESCNPSGTPTCGSLSQACIPGWSTRDFPIRLTQFQSIGWSATTGEISGSPDLPCEDAPCLDFNSGLVLGVPETLFRGELKCVQLDGETIDSPGVPAFANDLIGEATIIEGGGADVVLTAGSYNAVSFTADSAGESRSSNLLCLGDNPSGNQADCAVNYTPCSNVLVIKHFFDGARLPVDDATVKTHLTLVPCSEDLAGTPDDEDAGLPPEITTQVLVFNEFEQRYSTDLDVQCYRNTLLSDIDTRLNDSSDDRYSLFAFGTQGTLTGQTRLRGVRGAGSSDSGVGLLAVTHEFYTVEGDDDDDVVASAAYNSHMDSGMSRGDVVRVRDAESPNQ